MRAWRVTQTHRGARAAEVVWRTPRRGGWPPLGSQPEEVASSLSARKLARQPRSSLTCSAHWHARPLGRRRPGRAGCAAAAHHQAGARPPAARRSPPRSPPSQGCASQLHKQGAQQSTAHSTRRRARSTRRLTRESNTHTRTARAHRTPAQRCTQSTLDHPVVLVPSPLRGTTPRGGGASAQRPAPLRPASVPAAPGERASALRPARSPRTASTAPKARQDAPA